MRYQAPERGSIAPEVFYHPVFATLTPLQQQLCRALNWPEPADLNALWHPPMNAQGLPYQFKDQNALLDGKHYELRIAETGSIATRRHNWHDLFNAFVWQNTPKIKMALNRQQVVEIALVGTRERTRCQAAMTHFDEAGAVLRLDDAVMQAAWDEHDWPRFFRLWPQAAARGAVQLWLFGHSIYEHALNPDIALVAKAIVIQDRHMLTTEDMDGLVSGWINQRACLQDPQGLRPIPLSGIPGWHPWHDQADFFQRVPCFRPKRIGKVYPDPMCIADSLAVL